jgi:hypothetical protein
MGNSESSQKHNPPYSFNPMNHSNNIHKKMKLESKYRRYENNCVCKTRGTEPFIKRNNTNTCILNPHFVCNCLHK